MRRFIEANLNLHLVVGHDRLRHFVAVAVREIEEAVADAAHRAIGQDFA